MKIKKLKICSLILSCCAFVSLTACSNQTWSVKSGDVSLSMGAYICFLSEAYAEASEKLGVSSYSSSSEDTKSILKETIDDKNASDWIKDETITKCKEMIAVQKKFDEMGLSLSDEEQTQAQQYIDQLWEKYGKIYEKLGIAKDSYYKASILLSYQKQAIFKAIYDKDGTNAVSDEELAEYYKSNNANVSIIKKSLKNDSSDSALPDYDEDDLSDLDYDDDNDDSDEVSSTAAKSEEISSEDNDNSTQTEENSVSVEEVKSRFENYASKINSGTSVEDIAELYKKDESSEEDPVKTQTISFESSSYPDEVIEAIKSLEVGKAVAVQTDDYFYLVVKNDLTSELEKLQEDSQRESELYLMKKDEFENIISEYSNQLDYKINNYGISKHSPSMFEKKK